MSRRYRTKYLLNRRYRRIRRLKLAVVLLISGGIIGGTVYAMLRYIGESGIHPIKTPDIRLGGD